MTSSVGASAPCHPSWGTSDASRAQPRGRGPSSAQVPATRKPKQQHRVRAIRLGRSTPRRGRGTRRRESIGPDICAPGLADGVVGGRRGVHDGRRQNGSNRGCRDCQSTPRRSPDRIEPNVTSMKTAAAAAAPPHHGRHPEADEVSGYFWTLRLPARSAVMVRSASTAAICSSRSRTMRGLLVEHTPARAAAVEVSRGLGRDVRAAGVIDYRVGVSVTRHWSL